MIKQILVVDDDPDILDSLKQLLEFDGYGVKTLSDGDDTCKTAKDFRPNLIILDLMLSGRDGSLICRDLKQDSSLKNIPVIMISAHPGANKLAIAAGASGFIAKPFEVSELFTTIKQNLN